MANIFDKDTATTDNHLLNEQFHAFSKSPSSPGSTLGGASNRSGHTVSASDVWAEKIPAFFYPKADSDYAVCKANAKLNDICRWGDEIQIWNGTEFEKFADNYAAIPDGHEFLNEDGQPVVRFHKSRVAYNLNDTNNAYDNSLDASGKGASAKILGWDKTANAVYEYVESAPQFITQFVAPTDNIVKGVPSKGYGPIVMVDGSPLTEDADSDAGYIANNFAGIIQFNVRKTQGDVTVHAFEYCGKTLGTTASDIAELEDKLSKISVTASGGVQDASTNAKAAGFSVKTETRTSEGKEETIPVLDIETGSVTDSEGKLVTGGTVYNAIAALSTGAIAALDTRVGAAEGEIDALQTAVKALESGKLTYKVVHSVAGNGIGESTDTPTFVETSNEDDSAQNCVEYTIYLVPNDTIGAYVEYLCCKKGETLALEQIGTTATDLSGYATKLTTDATKSSDDNKLVKVTVTSGVTDAVKSVVVDDTELSNTIGKPADTSTNTKATGLYAVIEEAKSDAISKATVTITAGDGISLGNATSITGNEFTISAKPASTDTAGVTTISGNGAIESGATGNAAATVAAVGATRSAIEGKTIPATATGTSSDNHVKVTLGGTVGAPTVSVTTSDIASAETLGKLTTFVGKLPDKGVTATTVVGYAEEVAGAAQTAAIDAAKTAIVGSIKAYEANGLKVTAPTNTDGTIGAATFAMTKATTAGQTGTVQLAGTSGVDDTTDGVVATAAQVKSYVENNAKVSVSADDSASESVTSIKVAGNSGDDVVIATEKDTAADPADGAATITVSATLNKATVTTNADGTVTISDADKVKVVTAAGAQAIAAAAVNALDAVSVGDGAVKVTQENGKVKTVSTETAAITSGDNLVNSVTSTTALVTANEALKAIGVAKKYTDDEIDTISGSLDTHTENTDIHVSSDDRTAWDAAATKAGTAIQGVGSISGTYITATTEESDDHEITWIVNETGLANALDAKVNKTDIVTYTGEDAISVEIKGTTGTISVAAASSTATGTVKLSDATDGTETAASGKTAATPKAVSDALTTATNAIKIDSVIVDGAALTPTDKAVTIPTAKAGETGVGLVTLGSTDKLSGAADASSSKAATEAAVSKAIASLESTIATIKGTGVNYAVAETLPTAGVDYLGWIYLIKNTTSDAGDYLEHICVNKGTTDAPEYTWEQIGSTKADHTAYASTITLGTDNSVTVDDNVANLAGKVVTGVTTANGVSGSVDAATGALTLTVQDATSTQKGIVTLSTQDKIAAATGSTDTKVATVGAVAATIAALDVAAVSASDNYGLAWSQTDGKVSINLTTATVETATDGNSVTITNGGYLTTADDAKAIATAAVNALDASVDSTGVTGIKLTQTNGKVATIAVTAGAVADGGTAAVTAGGVKTYVDAAAAKATTKVKKADTTATADVTAAEPAEDGSITYIIDTLSDVTITATDVADATSVEGNKINGANKYVDWSRVTSAANAFASNTSLKSFHADLENLTNGNGMFNGCTGLTSFCGNLGSLTDGTNMFAGCNLDLESVIYIVDSLPAHSSGKHDITIGVNSALVGENEIKALAAELSAKGWGGSVTPSGSDTTE